MRNQTRYGFRPDQKPRLKYVFGMGQNREPFETHSGKLKLGIILAPKGETVIPEVLNFAAYLTGFPRAEKVALFTGHRPLGRRKLLAELISCGGTMCVDSARIFGRASKFRWCGPGQDEFPRNSLILQWLDGEVKKKVRAYYGRHYRHLILWVSLPPLPPRMTLDDAKLTTSLYSIGRGAENYAEFVGIHRNGRLDFLKFRAGEVFPNGSWKV